MAAGDPLTALLWGIGLGTVAGVGSGLDAVLSRSGDPGHRDPRRRTGRGAGLAVLVMALGGLVLWQFGPTWAGLRAVALAFLLVKLAVIDLETLRLPDHLTLPGTALGLASHLYPAPREVVGAMGGCLVAGGVLCLLALATRGGLGGGDVKLGAMMGAFLGASSGLAAVLFAVLASGAAALALLASGRKRRRDRIPFGPFLALGGVVAALWGSRIAAWCLG